jgi:hypothetical protein
LNVTRQEATDKGKFNFEQVPKQQRQTDNVLLFLIYVRDDGWKLDLGAFGRGILEIEPWLHCLKDHKKIFWQINGTFPFKKKKLFSIFVKCYIEILIISLNYYQYVP